MKTYLWSSIALVAMLLVVAPPPSASAVRVGDRNAGAEDEWTLPSLWNKAVTYFSGDEDDSASATAKQGVSKPQTPPPMTAQDKVDAAASEKSIHEWVTKQGAGLSDLTQVTLDVAVPCHVPRVKIAVSGTVVVEKASSGKGVTLAGELAFGITLDVAVEVNLRLVGSLEVKCPSCDTLMQTLQYLSYTVMKDYAEDHLQTLMYQDESVSKNIAAFNKGLGESRVVGRLKQIAEADQYNFLHGLRKLREQLDVSASVLYPQLIGQSGVQQDGHQALAQGEQAVASSLKEYENLLSNAYKKMMEAYISFGVVKPGNSIKHECDLMARKQVGQFRLQWESILKQTKAIVDRGMVGKAAIQKLEGEWKGFANVLMDGLEKGKYPKGYLALQERIGYDTRTALQSAVKAHSGLLKEARAKLDKTVLTINAALGVALGASGDLRKSSLGFEFRGVIGKSGDTYPLKQDPKPLTPYYAFFGGVEAEINEVTIAIASTVVIPDKGDKVWDTVITISHPLRLKGTLQENIQTHVKKHATAFVNGARRLFDQDTLTALAQGGSAASSMLGRFSKAATTFFSGTVDHDGEFMSSGRVRLKTGPFYEIKLSVKCPSGSKCALQKPEVKVGWTSGDLLEGLGNLLAKTDAISNSPIDVTFDVQQAKVWQLQL